MYRPSDKAAFQVDLVQQHALCEINYARLLKLLPEFQEQDYFRLSITHGSEQRSHTSELKIKVLQRAPYTTLISIKIAMPWSHWFSTPDLEVRLYHDAQMAEVVMAQKVRQFSLVTEYPNKRMALPNEKLVLNQFLSELLDFCMSGGHVPEQVF